MSQTADRSNAGAHRFLPSTEAMDYDLCIALTYYAPYVSGLTNVARDIAEGLAARGRRVVVVASRHDTALPLTERVNGVDVVRTPVMFRLGKGVISPAFVPTALRLARRARCLNLHLPMLEAGLLARQARNRGIAVVSTYQCDVSLSGGPLAHLQNHLMDASARAAIRSSSVVTVSSHDYARHSRLSDVLLSGAVAVPPTCHERPRGRARWRDGPGLHVGFLGRIVEEKGIEYLIQAFTSDPDPQARLLIGGDFSAVAGGSVIDHVRAHMAGDPRIRLLGFVPDDLLADFYASIDVFALPSINAFEAFGIVQVEAMLAGVPVIATDLPGVRQPVLRTGMGRLVKPRSAQSIGAALEALRAAPPDTVAGVQLSRQLYGVQSVLDQFEQVLRPSST